jgi:GNAT superfamily N-acetyltransferase
VAAVHSRSRLGWRITDVRCDPLRLGRRADAAVQPGVRLRSTRPRRPGEGDAEILTATDPAQLGDFAVVASEAFGAPLEAASTLSPASTLDDERCSWFLGYLDDEPAACGQLFRTADVAGVYSIGVRERFRRRGLGAAITAAVLAAGRDSGCSIGVLQASPMGAPVYDRMGFETVTQYHRFAPAG